MFTIASNLEGKKAPQEFFCLSTDEKPTDYINGAKITNGSVITEIDTGKKFIFDEENKSWVLWSKTNYMNDGVVSWDEIKGRPFYEGEPEECYPLPIMTISRASSLSSGKTYIDWSMPIEIGATYEVIYNDEVYTAECYQGTIGASLGDEALQEYPFYLFDGGDISRVSFVPQEEPVTVGVRGYIKPIKKLEIKFIEGFAGKNVEGQTFEYNGEQYTAAYGAEIFNNYDMNKAVGECSHAEGYGTKAFGDYSHAEGIGSVTEGNGAHAEGGLTKAIGADSHAEGSYTIASGEAQHVQGKYNIEDTEDKYAHIVGNGKRTADGDVRSNAHTLDWEGNAEYQGDVVANGCGGENPVSLLALNEKVKNGGGASGGGMFLIKGVPGEGNIPMTSYKRMVIDKTYEEIKAAYESGQLIALMFDQGEYYSEQLFYLKQCNKNGDNWTFGFNDTQKNGEEYIYYEFSISWSGDHGYISPF